MQTPATQTENKASKSSKPNGKFFGKGQDMPFFQAKLTVNQPGDAYEQEADQVADQVMRMPDPVQRGDKTEKNGAAPVEIQRKVAPVSPAPVEVKQPAATPALSRVQTSLVQAKCVECSQKEKEQKEEERQEGQMPVMRATKVHDINGTGIVPVQRACAECAKEETAMRKEKQPAINGSAPVQIQRACAGCEQEEEMPAMRKENGGDPGGQAAPSIVSDVISSGSGRPLDGGTRDFMESRFGQDFGQVRIHTDAQAAESASAINARAYTSGNNVVFGNGEYQPETDSGRRLLAHELVHVGQQGEGISPENKPGIPAAKPEQAEESVKETDQAEAAPGIEQPLIISEEGVEKPAPEARSDQKSGQQQDKAVVGETGRTVKSEKAKPKPEAPEKEPKEERPGAEEGPGGKDAATGGAEEEPPPVELDTTNSAAMLNSLGPLPATSFVAGMQKVGELAPGVQQHEKGELEQSLPVMEQPTGLPTKKQRELEKAELEKGQVPDIKPEGKKEGQQLEIKHQAALGPVPNNKTLVIQEPKENPEDGLSWWDRIKSILKRSFGTIQTKDDSVNTSAGERPKVDTTGEADPRQNDEARAKSDESMTQEKQKADQSTQEYRGENDIYPDLEPEMLKSTVKPAPPEMREGRKFDLKALAPDVRQSLDVNLQTRLDKEAAPEIAKNDAEYRKQQEDSDKEKAKTDEEIEKETGRVRELQENEQAGAKKQVGAERENWRKEHEKVQKTYQDSSTEKRKEIDGKIDTEIKTTEKRADEKLTEAESKAKAEKQKAEDEAARKKKEEESRPRSWWDRVKGAVSNFFKKLKAAINAIFDGLRKLVKGIIEAAKKVVNGIIDLARKAIVGLIKVFGEALKGFLKIALAAFPELRDKALAAVDKAVNKAVKVVNDLADGLKNFVNKALDALGAALDFILSVYQKAFNLLVDVLEFLTVGLLIIMEAIANLVAAAREMPDHFWEQMLGELFGVDEPLPFERTAPPDSAKAVSDAAKAGELPAADAGLLGKNELNPDDTMADPIAEMELDPEMNDQLLAWGDGEEREFAGSENPLTLEEVRGSASSPEAAPGEATGVTPQMYSGQEQAAAAEPQQELSVDQQLEEMVNNIPSTCEPDKNAKPAGNEEFPEAQKIGPLTVNQRLSFVMGAMKKGISTWWECNKVAIILAIIGLVLGVVILNILTAGAIMAAIPPLLQILAAYFLAEALVKASSYFGGFFTKGFAGDTTGAAKDLARALAIVSIELIFAVVFELKALFKALKGGLKAAMKSGVKVAKSSVKATVKAFKQLGNIAIDGGKATLKNGKLVFKGIAKGFGKGVKNMDDLMKKLKDRFRFKRFKFRRNGMRFSLFGEFNPWVLLATGEIKEVKTRGGVKVGQKGKFVTKEGDESIEGILIGGNKKASLFVKHLQDNPALRASINELAETAKHLDIDNIIKGLSRTPVDKIDEIVKGIDNLKNIDGIGKVLSDLAGGGNFPKGAQWVLEFAGKNKKFAQSITKLESKIDDVGRIYDVQAGSVFYEFKNWTRFVEPSFIKQIARDIKNPDEFRWVFSNAIGKSASEVREIARNILNNTKKLKAYLSEADIAELTKRSNIERVLDAIRVIQ